jgi:hypothetical protein
MLFNIQTHTRTSNSARLPFPDPGFHRYDLLVFSKVHDGNTHDFSISARLALESLVFVKVIHGIDPDTISWCNCAHERASSHLLDMLLSISRWTVALTLVKTTTTVRVTSTHGVIGLGVADDVVVLVDLQVGTAIVQMTT